MTNDLTGAHWFKSSHSGGDGECVEVAWLGARLVGVRDSKHPAGPALMFSPAEWAAFTSRMKGHGSLRLPR